MARRKIVESLRFEYQRLEHNPPQEIDQTIERFKAQQKIVDEKYKRLLSNLLPSCVNTNLLTQEKGKSGHYSLYTEVPYYPKCYIQKCLC